MLIKAINLQCESQTEPFIDQMIPHLNWQVEAEGRNRGQSAYQIQVGSSAVCFDDDSPDLWDTGKIISEEMSHIPYEGTPLRSRMNCWWRVRLWDEQGYQGPWSELSRWSMGLLQSDEWSASWIGTDQSVFYLKRTIEITKTVRDARAYMTALGLYELLINGQKVSNYVFTPGWTDYNERIYYHIYDISAYLKPGHNVLTAIVAPGWQCGYIGSDVRKNYYSSEPRLKGQFEIAYNDGQNDIIVTDENWKWREGPIRMADILHGEEYDARREINDSDEKEWKPVEVFEIQTSQLQVHPGDPVEPIEELAPIAMEQPIPGIYVFDLGQNFVGWIRLRIHGATRGRRIIIRYGEMLNEDGTVYTANLRHAQATDIYYAKGTSEEYWQPKFTFHGFRYVQIQGYPSMLTDPTANEPDLNTVRGIVVHSALTRTGSFECSHPKVNQLFQNICWGQRSNFFEIPTDCPQRDERLGWTGDAQVFIRTASYLTDIRCFFQKWLTDVSDAQHADGAISDIAPKIDGFGYGNAGWGDAAVICPWVLYQVYGDRRILMTHWSMMTRWIDYLEENSQDFIRPDSGWGDWLSVESETPKELLGTAYFAYSTYLVSQVAKVLEKPEQARRIMKLFDKIKEAYVKKFIDSDGRVEGDTQTGYLLSLNFGLVPPDLQEASRHHLIENIKQRGWRLTTGFLGISYLNPLLTQIGRSDVAYRLLMQEQFPSWLYEVNQGATTIWERWDSWTHEKGFQSTAMNSFNHYSFGSVGQWLMADVAGIDMETPGFKKIRLCPHLGDGLSYVCATYESVSGKIHSYWRHDDDIWTWRIEIPANTTASVYIPLRRVQAAFESGVPIEKHPDLRYIGRTDSRVHLEMGSGTYVFEIYEINKKHQILQYKMKNNIGLAESHK